MTVIISVAITTVGCSVTCTVICPHTLTHTFIYSHTCMIPDIRTGSSSLTVFMELTSICLCSWCVSSCCLSSIIFDILVIPGEREQNGGDVIVLWKLEATKIKLKRMRETVMSSCLASASRLRLRLSNQRLRPPMSSSNTSKHLMSHWSRTMTASAKCEKTLASDFLRLIMPQCTDNTIDLLPLMINRLLCSGEKTMICKSQRLSIRGAVGG